MADWKSVAGSVIALGAPTLGRIVGELSPIPGSGILAEWGIKALANLLDIPVAAATPEVVQAKIDATPPDVLKTKLETAEREAEDRWQALTAMHKEIAEQNKEAIKSIGLTQREEIAKGVSWYHWRHQLGYCTLAFGWATVIAFTFALFVRGTDIAQVSALITAVMPVIGILAALNGYVAADTTALKIAAVTGQPAPTGIAAVVGAVKK